MAVFYSFLATLVVVIGAEVPGCFKKGYDYSTNDYVSQTAAKVVAPRAENCQAHCAGVEGAGGFIITDAEAAGCFCIKGAPYVPTLELQGGGPDRISGPTKCEKVPPACSAKLIDDTHHVGHADASWPKATAEAGFKAWTTGYQPQKLQCWPHVNGKPYACPEEVKSLNEALDIEDWPGNCSGLRETTIAEKDCEKNCYDNAACSGYVIQEGNNKCWQSSDVPCLSTGRPAGFKAKKTKRVARGSIRVIETLTGAKVAGLTQMFDFDEEMKMTKSAIENCKHICYSLMGCSMWQLSSTKGCYVEHPSTATVQYPMTLSNKGMDTQSADAATFEAGEFIQRTCTHKPKEVEEKPFYKKLWFLIGAPVLLLLLCLGVFLALRMCGKDKKRTPRSLRSRALAEPQQDTKPLLTQTVQMVQVPVYQQVAAPQQVVYQTSQVVQTPRQISVPQVVQTPRQVIYEQPQVIYEQPQVIMQPPVVQTGAYEVIQQEPSALTYAAPQAMTYMP